MSTFFVTYSIPLSSLPMQTSPSCFRFHPGEPDPAPARAAVCLRPLHERPEECPYSYP